MLKKIIGFPLVAVLFSSVLGGCYSTEEYQRLSEAGTKYVQSLDILLESAGEIKIDTTSEQLLADDRILNRNIDYYQARNELDLERLAILNDLRRHNRLLARYFILLDELATSDAPETSEQEIAGIFGNINTVGARLRGNGLFPQEDVDIVSAASKIIISGQIKGALRDELEARKETIAQELDTQERLLSVLGDSIQNELILREESVQNRLIIRPYIEQDPIVREDAWITNRKQVLLSQATATELGDAAKAAQNFRKMFLEAISEDFDRARFNFYLGEIEAFLAIVENIKPNQ